MSRQQAIKKVNDTYKEIFGVFSTLKSYERKLDDKRAMILIKLENIFKIVNSSSEYKEGIKELNDEGYWAYADMLTKLLDKMVKRVSLSNLPKLNMNTISRYLSQGTNMPEFRANGPVHNEKEKTACVLDIGEIEINEYKDFIEIIKSTLEYLFSKELLRPNIFISDYRRKTNTILGVSLKEDQPQHFSIEGDIIKWVGVTNYVKNEKNNKRDDPNVETIPKSGEKKQWYYPRTFPNGIWEIKKSRIPEALDQETLGKVYIPTNATQFVLSYGSAVHNPVKPKYGRLIPSDIQEDSGYGLHFSNKKDTWGCIRFESQSDADKFATISDSIIGKSGISYLIVNEE